MILPRGSFLGNVFLVATTFSTVVSSFGLGGITLAPASPSVPTANTTGPYQVGVRSQTYVFQGRNLTLYMWYPASPAVGSTPFVSAGGVLGQAVQNAPLNSTGGPYPLIMFSPGLAAYADAYYFYTQNLASNGYIVASFEHYDTKTAVPSTNATYLALSNTYQVAGDGSSAVETLYTDWFRNTQLALTYRAQEIEFFLDTVIQSATNTSSIFSGAIDTNNIGLSGHSLGAYYTLLVGGGLPINCDYSMTAQQLDPNNTVLANVSACAFPARQALASPSALKDSRIKAIIPLAAPFFIVDSQIPRAAAEIKIPLMIITGDDVTLESTRGPQLATFNNASGPSHWVMVTNTSHYLVGDSYQLNPTFGGRISAADKTNFTEKAAVYMTYSTAFFDLYLKNHTSANSTLQKVLSPFVADLQYHAAVKATNTTSSVASSGTATSAPSATTSSSTAYANKAGLLAATVGLVWACFM